MLNKPSTQVRYDSIFGNVLGVDSKNIYAENTVYNAGGFFFTGEIGGKAMISKNLSVYLSIDYSLWAISGTYYLSEKEYLLGSTGLWAQVGKNESTEKTIAYVHAFLLRLGIAF